MRVALLFLCVVGLAVPSCSDPGKIVDIQREGTVAGVAFIDMDADGALTANVDVPAAGVAAALVLEATNDTVARTTTRADGSFVMARVPVGSYRLVANRGALGDTLEVQHVDSARLQLAAGDTVVRLIRIGFPRVSAAAARLVPTGRRVIVEGLALNSWATFADSSLHVQDMSAALRSIRVRPSTAQAGDSIRLLGTLGVEAGRPVLVDVIARVLAGARGLPAIDSMSTRRASTADDGRRADAQARIAGATVLDTQTVGQYRRVSVDDGSGQLELLLHRGIAFSPQAYTPGAVVSVSGILAHTGTQWQLKPRRPDEVTASFPAVTAAQARTLSSGTRVLLTGIALNGWSTFGDSTLHIADASGAIRAIRVLPSSVVAGDSVRVLGVVGLSEGRVALVDAAVTIAALARGLPSIDSASTSAAATAAGGRADGQLRIGGIIRDTATIGGDLIIGVDDGSGRIEVVLDRNISFNPGPWLPGATLRAAGVLVPAATGSTWRLKPRDRNEAVLSFPTVTVEAARALEQGRRIVLEGVALNSWSAFGDSSVHILDRTGALRAVRVQNAVSAGDSVRLLGVTAMRNGQPVLSGVTGTVLRVAVGVPEPDSIPTARARTADNGRLDAMQVRVGGTIMGNQVLPDGDVVFTIDDGSGLLEVFFDKDVNFNTGPYVPGALLRASGVLVPAATGNSWQLKPRGPQDAVAIYPTVTVAQARALAPGRNVYIEGTALNGWVTYGDSTVHVRDATGTIRTMRIPPTAIFAGDSVRILGTVAVRNGQPVLTGLNATVLLARPTLSAPDSVQTVVAANAQGGLRDAGQVATSGTITAIDSTTADWVLTIDDGSGPLRVMLDKDIGFATGALRINARIRARGLLVPATSGTEWILKPRSINEIFVIGS